MKVAYLAVPLDDRFEERLQNLAADIRNECNNNPNEFGINTDEGDADISLNENGAFLANLTDQVRKEYEDDESVSNKLEEPIYVINSACDLLKEAGKIVIHGKMQIVSNINPDSYPNYVSPVVKNPTWWDVLYYANEMIKTTGDYNHVFLEDINHIETNENGVKICELQMGS